VRLSIWIALRHLAAMRRRSFLGRVSLLAVLGVAVGVATLVTVLAFVGGFQAEVRDLLTGMNPSIFLTKESPGGIDPGGSLAGELMSMEDIVAISPFVQQKGVLSRPGEAGLKLAGCLLRGVDPDRERRVTRLLDSCRPPLDAFKNWDGKPGILLGSRLAEELSVLPGEEVTFTTLLEGVEDPTHQVFLVQGIVESGLYEFDRRFAYMDLDSARSIFRSGKGVDGLGLRVADPLKVRRSSREIRHALSFPPWRVSDWMDLNGEIFRWMSTMRSILFLSLSLIVLVAGFNIAGTMTLVVSEKSREIGVLRSLGTSRGTIMRLFVFEGWMLGMAGVGLGLLLSWVMALIFKGRPLGIPGEVYFIDHLPMRMAPGQVAGVCVLAILVTLGAALFPGIEALMRRPVESISGTDSAPACTRRGLLRFFITLHVYWLPILGTVAMLASVGRLASQGLSFPLLPVLPGAAILAILLLIRGISVGISLNMLDPGALRDAMRLLIWNSIFLLLAVETFAGLAGKMGLAVQGGLLLLLLHQAGWYLYLRYSPGIREAFAHSMESRR